jgi:hypothetical protein
MKHRAVLIAAFALFALYLITRSLQQSQAHIYPLYDEVNFLTKARGIRDQGGILPSIRLYLQGADSDDWYQPLYPFFLSKVMGASNSVLDFTRAKLLSLFFALILVALTMAVTYRRSGELASILAGGLTAGSAATLYMSHMVWADSLFAIFFLGSLASMDELGTKARSWIVPGILVGLAYLTKANGHILLLGLLVSGAFVFRNKVFARPPLYVSVASFLLVTSFLLTRNVRVWHDPFYFAARKNMWLDNWTQHLVLRDYDVWNQIGWRWFLEHHSAGMILRRFSDGFRNMAGISFESLSFLSFENSWRYGIGAGLVILAGAGLTAAWKMGRHAEVTRVSLISGILFLLFSLFSEHTLRYAFPIIICAIPYAAEASSSMLQLAWEKLRRSPIDPRWATGSFTFLFIILFIRTRSVFEKDPRTFYLIPQTWQDTTAWIKTHIPEEKFIIDTWSHYSAWEEGPDHRLSYPFAVEDRLLQTFIQKKSVKYAMVESLILGNDPYREKYGKSDVYGPMSFLGWPRCFHDQKKPSRFLIYSSNAH